MINKKGKIAIVVVIALLVLGYLGWNGYTYYKYYQVYNIIVNDSNTSENNKYYGRKATEINIPVKESIDGYVKTTLDWISFETPAEYGSEYETLGGSNGTNPMYVFTNTSGNKVGIWPRNYFINDEYSAYGEALGSLGIDNTVLEKYGIDFSTDKEFYDAIYMKDYSKINLFSSTEDKIIYGVLLSFRNAETPYGETYYFSNNNNQGYLIVQRSGDAIRMVTVRLIDDDGKLNCEFIIEMAYDSFDMETIKNIIGSVVIK